MALGTVEQRKGKILELLKDDNVTPIVLVGESGIGKTWTAREISDLAIGEELFNITLWVFLNRKYDNKALYENIAHQLSLLSPTEEWEDDDGNEEVEGEKEWTLENLKQKISSMLVGKKCLLILDGEGNKMKVKEIVLSLKDLLPPNQQNQCKVLITRIESDRGDIIEEIERVIEVGPLSVEESLHLLRERSGITASEFSNFQYLLKAISEKCMGLPAAIIMIAEALSYLREPDSGVWTLASALEEAANDENENVTQLLCSVNDMLPSRVLTECCWHSLQFFRNHGPVHYNELISYWIMEGYIGPGDHIGKAYKKGHYVLMKLIKLGMLKKQEDNVIIMEGAMLKINDRRHHGFCGKARLGLANVFEDGEWEGLGRITQMDGMIKTLCNGKKWQKLSTLLLDGNRLCREVPETFFQRIQGLQVLALFNPKLKSLPMSLSNMQKLLVLVLRGCDLLENIAHIQELKTLTVLEISGAKSLEILPDDLFKQLPNLRSLNLSAIQITSLPSSLFSLSELRWLILRDCSRLKTLPKLKGLKSIEVLDLSGATSLEKIEDKKFESVQKLQTLNLSETQIDRLPILQSLGELTRLLLSGCSRLARLPKLNSLSSLQILDLSGAGIKEILDDSLKNKEGLKILDLSGTEINRVPANIGNLSYLHLRGCSQLEKLPSTVALKHLKLIDLSGAANLAEIEDRSFEHLRYLRVLNLSKTKVKNLPSLSNLGNLRHLFLKDCSLLETLPEMKELPRLEVLDLSGVSLLREVQCQHLNHRNLHQLLLPGCLNLVKFPHLDALKKLEVLDLSGCSALMVIENQSFEHMTCLSRLNLSGTKIESLPSLSNLSNLSHLLLTDCINLKSLPPLQSLSKLEELNLCGASSLLQIQVEFLEHMIDLRILDLSRTPIVKLPSMSKLTNLTHLSLRCCSDLKIVLDLGALTKLEVLDLSGTAVGSPLLLNSLSNLRELSLRDCSRLFELPLESLRHLEVLDLFGTRIKDFPYWISDLTHLKCLSLPDMKDIQVDWGKIKCFPEELNWDECGISKLAEVLPESSKPEVLPESSKPCMIMRGTKFFQLLNKNPQLWETCFKKFHFSVCFEEHGKEGDIYFHRNEFIFRDIYSETRYFSFLNEHSRSLEIHGFCTFPVGIGDVLRRAEFLSLIENKFITCLSDLGAENLKDMKGCWIERCTKVDGSLFGEEEHDTMGRGLEILWVSNMTNLKSLYSGNMQSECFKNLNRLYLDCCPMLVNVFSSSQVPENLEILQIKFCERVETVFGPNTSAECKLQKLRIVHLLELPELKSIGGALPSLKIFKATECPMLVNVFPTSQLPENLEILQIKFCDNLETVFKQNASAVCTLPKLHTLHLWGLPKLNSIGGECPSLQSFEVRECPILQELDGLLVNRGN